MTTWTHSAARILCAATAAIPLLFGTVQAQGAPHLERGTQIRFYTQVLDTHPPTSDSSNGLPLDVYMAGVRERRVTATVLSSDADTLRVRLSRGGAHLSLPWESVGWVEERNRTRATVMSALVGAAGVGVPLAVLGASVWEEDLPVEYCSWTPGSCRRNRWQSPTETAVQLGLRGAVVGGAIGFTLGAMGVFDHWKPVAVPARVAVVPGRDHLVLSASVRF